MNFESAPHEAAKTEAPLPEKEKREFSPELKRAAGFYHSMLLSEDMGINLQSKEIVERIKAAGVSKDGARELSRVRSMVMKKMEEGAWREGNPLGALFEEMLVVEGRHADLFGPDANVVRSAEPDDIKSGVDLVLELPIDPEDDYEEGNLARITIDATVSESREVIKHKLTRLREKPLRTVDYFISPTTDEPVRIEKAPHVILNIPGSSLARFIEKSGLALFYPDPAGPKKNQYTASGQRKKILETFGAARGLLDSIDAQLLAQSILQMEHTVKSFRLADFSPETDEAIASVFAASAAIGDPFSASKAERDSYFASLDEMLNRARFEMLRRTGKPFEPDLLLSRAVDAHKAVSFSINKKAAERAAAGGPKDSRPIVSPAFEASFRAIYGGA